MAASSRAFILRETRLRPVPGVDGVRLHLADEILPLWHALQLETGDPDTPLPYWAFAWGGGLAMARYLGEHPEAVADRRVLDLGSGSGLAAIAAMRAGASSTVACDIDPLAVAAIPLNARANGVRLDVVRHDLLHEEPPPDIDIILAADTWYETGLARRVLPWLQRAQAAGIDVLVGDPGRADLPTEALAELAVYDVRTTTDMEDLRLTQGRVYRLREGA